MAVSIDLNTARQLLVELIAEAEASPEAVIENGVDLDADIAAVMASNTGAFRQALVGSGLVRLLAPHADLKLPSTEHGDLAYSGRTIDESVVMPELGSRRIPSSQSSAYLSTLRRGKRFVDDDAVGVRDRATYAAANRIIQAFQDADDEEARALLVGLLRGFLGLRERSRIDLISVQRLSLTQLTSLTKDLLNFASGGRFPVFITQAALDALNEVYGLDWTIHSQGINEADSAAGRPGDVTVSKGGSILFAIEITERSVDENRVRNAMNEKVMPAGVTDYLYFITSSPTDDARAVAQTYFGQGHDVNFIDIATWTAAMLSLSSACRQRYSTRLRDLICADDCPVALKVAWNAAVTSLF